MKPTKQILQHWPVWETPNDKSQLELAKVLMPYIKILSPEIVKEVVAENNNNLRKWTNDFFSLNIRPDIYLWTNSPVTFPGVRRHVGKAEEMEVKKNRNNATGANALLLDDNSFPKDLWSYVLRGRKADKKGPANYSLAHIVDHKDYKSRHLEEIKNFQVTTEKYLYAGLHTSCANTIWVPNSLLKPTDHRGRIRQLLLQLVEKYYQPVCNLLPNNQKLNLDNINDEWNLENFPAPTIVGDISMTKEFIKYRNELIEKRIKNYI